MTYCIACPPPKPRRFYSDAANDYIKRLGRFCKVRFINSIEKTGARDVVIAFSPDGAPVSSETMASKLASLEAGGAVSRIVFAAKQNNTTSADEMWMLTSVVISDDLFITLLLEQLYRAQKIMHNEPYHK